jgi:hypothetical protein
VTIHAYHAAQQAEDAARAELVAAEQALRHATQTAQAARATYLAATRRRIQAMTAAARSTGLPIPEVRAKIAPVCNPDDLVKHNRIAAREAAYRVLEREDRPLLSVELGPMIGIPARAVRNYLSEDPRFVIDHAPHAGREAVRVRLAGGAITG